MAIDLVALALVCLAAGFGAARGALAGAVGLATLFGAGAAALLAAPRLGPRLAVAAELPAALGTPLAGGLVFAFASVTLGLVGRWLRELETPRPGSSRSALDRLVGGLLGALRGAIRAAIVAWIALVAEALRAAGVAPALPPLGDSIAARLASSAVEAGALAALGADPAGRVAARLAARPAQSLEELDRVLAAPSVLALRDDGLFWTYLEHGETTVALHRASFLDLTRDAELRRRLHALALVDERAAEDPAAFRDAMAEVLEEVGPRLRKLRDDPEFERLARDPELLALARSGDPLALASHPGVRALAARAVTAP
jgi:uncharacterized membrane protein required for colicin V production